MCGKHDSDMLHTQPGLAMTPSQVADLAKHGVSVSTPNLPNLYDNEDSGWKVDPVFDRGADLNTLWETERIAQRNVLAARKRDKSVYGVRNSM